MFPLPLTCLEEYMLCDDRPGYPMTGVFRLRFSGVLERAAFEAAVATAVERHALLRTTVCRAAGRRPQWIDHPGWRPPVHWQAPANADGFPETGYIDLTQEPGTRVWVVDRDEGQDVVLQVHHACADALGMNVVLEDLLLGYAQGVGAAGERGALPELDYQRFPQRGAPGLTIGRFLKMAPQQAVGLHGVWEFLMHAPVPLGGAVAIDAATPPATYPCPRRFEFDPHGTRQIIAAAKSRGVTVNELLVRDLFLAVRTWRKARGIGSDRDWLRVSVPMNLRRAEDARMPMANSVSSVFLDRQPRRCADAERLLRGIRRQMQRIKRLQLQYTFLLSLGLTRLLPGGLAGRRRMNECQLTSYFSNLGPVLDRLPLPRRDGRLVCGNAVLEGVDYVIPLRPFVHASFCVYTYAGRLCLLMHPDRRAVTAEDATALLAEFVQQICRSVPGLPDAG